MRVALTGPTGDFGTLLLPRLREDAARGAASHARNARSEWFRAWCTTASTSPASTSSPSWSTCSARPKSKCSTTSPFSTAARGARRFAHEVEVIGTLHVLAAAARAGVKKLVVPSYTLVYGARPGNPALLREDAPLHGCPASRFVSDRVEVETADGRVPDAPIPRSR